MWRTTPLAILWASSSAQNLTPPGPPLPYQSELQASITRNTQKNASVASVSKRAELVARWADPDTLQQIWDVCPSLNGSSVDAVLERFYAELAVVELTHNFLWEQDDHGFEDDSLDSLGNASYVYNLWELDLLGFFPRDANRSIEEFAERVGMRFPGFPGGVPPNYTAAADRPLYAATNFMHLDLGDPMFGDMAIVLNRSYADPLSLVAPADTGNFFSRCYWNESNPHCGYPFSLDCAAWADLQMGSLANLSGMVNHILLANDVMWTDVPGCPNTQQPNVVRNFQRICYHEHPPSERPAFDMEIANATLLSFMEVDLAGMVSVTSGVKFLVAQATSPGLFGTQHGDALREMAVRWGRVLVWGLGTQQSQHGGPSAFMANDTRLVDPVVLGSVGAGGNVTAAATARATAAFQAFWANASKAALQKQQWESLVVATGPDLTVRSMRANECADTDKCIGVSRAGECFCYNP